MKTITKIIVLTLCLLSGGWSFGQTLVVPNGYENTNIGGTFIGPLANGARSYQLLIHEDQLTDMIDQNINGISFRSAGGASTTWPANLTTYNDYDIYLSEGVAPANKSLIFANNVVGTQTQVRSGSLAIEPDTYDVSSAVNFGPTITFTNPYTYTGGHLLLEIRHSGSDGTSKSVDAVLTSNSLYGSAVGANWVSSMTPPEGNASQGNAAVVRFSHEPSVIIPVVSVEVDTQDGVPAEITTDDGTLQLVATINPTDVVQTVAWTIESGTGLATVDSDGLVTAIDNGTVTVRATSTEDNTLYDEISIESTNEMHPVASVEIETQSGVPAEITTDDGTLQLVATVSPTNAVQTVVWSIESGTGLATVDTDGLVTAIDNGTVTVRATSTEDNTLYDELSITITNQVLSVASVEVETQGGVPAEITTFGGTLQLIAIVNPSNSQQTVTWSIEAGADSASVDNDGLVTAIDDGSVTIRATSTEDGNIFGEIIVTITNQTPDVESVAVSTLDDVEALITTIGDALQLVATVSPTDAIQTVIWSVESGANVVSIDEDGLITALENGEAWVRATSTEDDTVFGELLVIVDTTASVDNLVMDSVKIYPNPTNGIVFISTNQHISSLEVYNLIGQRVIAANNTDQIDLSQLNTGTYIIKINTEKGTVSHRIVKN